MSRRSYWALLLVGPALGLGAGALQESRPHPATAHVLYGIPAGDPSANGRRLACTDETLDASGHWGCQSWTIDMDGLPIAVPLPYPGTCAHVQVDQEHGRWVCVSARREPVAPGPQT
ncbi:MAG: hypothetical protein ACRDLK_03020 [Gaiellaceae bacterium]